MQYGVKIRTVLRESVVPLLLGSPCLALGIWMYLAERFIGFIVLYVAFLFIILIYWSMAASFRARVTASRVERVLFGQFIVRAYPVSRFAGMGHNHIVFEGGRTMSLLGVEEHDLNQIALLLAAKKEEALAAPDCIAAPRQVRIDPAWLGWNDGVVVRVAGGLAEDLSPDRLAVLADALEEAGCDDRVLLDHLRSPGRHSPGCWAVDRCLGLG